MLTPCWLRGCGNTPGGPKIIRLLREAFEPPGWMEEERSQIVVVSVSHKQIT